MKYQVRLIKNLNEGKGVYFSQSFILKTPRGWQEIRNDVIFTEAEMEQSDDYHTSDGCKYAHEIEEKISEMLSKYSETEVMTAILETVEYNDQDWWEEETRKYPAPTTGR